MITSNLYFELATMVDDNNTPAQALNSIIQLLAALSPDDRERVLKAVATFFNSAAEIQAASAPNEHPNVPTARSQFSADRSPSPKLFLIDKQPRTDVERIACLAYYLTHFRDTPYFKTFDLAKLNTEAAQPKFSNTAYAATNAANMGYLAPGPKGQRQLSAAGEQFVAALPDRDAAKTAMSAARPRRPSRKK